MKSQRWSLESIGPQAQHVRLAEMIAARLREQILVGSLANGMLPKQEELMSMFGVSGPSVREALRILEVEGLITVRRGKMGGSEIHRPNGASTARAIGLTLQGEGTRLADLAETLLTFEPACAAECALSDNRTEVGYALDKNLAESEAVLGEGAAFTHLARQFHDIIVGAVPNQATRLIVRSLVAVWSSQEETWASEMADSGQYPDDDAQRSVLAAHRRIARNIQLGHAVAAETTARKHLRAAQKVVLSHLATRVVDAASPRALQAFRNIAFDFPPTSLVVV